jgi:hypothetical protein
LDHIPSRLQRAAADHQPGRVRPHLSRARRRRAARSLQIARPPHRHQQHHLSRRHRADRFADPPLLRHLAADSEASTAQKQEAKQAQVEANDDTTKALQAKTFYPFTFPITSGPGTLVVTLTLSAHAERHTVLAYSLSHAGVFLAIVALSLFCYFCYAYAPRLTRAISPGTVHGIVRVMAFIVLSIGVQIMWNGFTTLYAQLPQR